MSLFAVDKLISEARRLAAEYRRTTGKSLGISGEIAKHDACRLLDLELCEEQEGFDAMGLGERDGKRIQIKGRAIFNEAKGGQRIGKLKIDQEWDSIVLVLMDEDFEPYEIYEVDREEIMEDINKAGQSKRAKRGVMSVARFKNVGRLAWTREEGMIDDEIWDNQVEA